MDNGISKIPENPDGGVMTELYSGTLMSEDSTDYIVPEYIPDTGKILLCTASPKIRRNGVFQSSSGRRGRNCVGAFLLGTVFGKGCG